MQDKIIDMTLADPAFIFEEIMDYGFEHSRRNMNQYIVNNPDYQGEEGAKDINDTTRSIAPAMVKYGFLDADKQDRIGHCTTMTSGGASEAFVHVLRILLKDVQKQRKAGKTIKPVLVMPVPTYGYFVLVAKDMGFSIATLPRDMQNGGTLNPELVRKTIDRVQQKGMNVVGFYDCNPHNPTGLVRGEEETRELANIIMAANKKYYANNKWKGAASRIRIIDDLIGFGTEYQNIESAYSFMQIPECRDDCFLLLGLSKIGLPGLRAGFLMSPEDDMAHIQRSQQYVSYFPARPAMYALQGYYNLDEDFQKRKITHLKTLNGFHKENGYLFKALVNGLDSMDELSSKQKQTLVTRIATLKNIDEDAAQTYINTPLSGIKIITTPQSGMCHVLDMNDLKGTKYLKHEEKNRKEYHMLTTPLDIKMTLFDVFKIMLVPSTWMGAHEDDAIYRITFACPAEDIIETVERLREFIPKIEKI